MSASVTLIGLFTPEYLDQFIDWMQKHRLSGKNHWLTNGDDKVSVVKITLNDVALDEAVIRAELLVLSNHTGIDHIYQSTQLDIKTPGVAVFDMDSTLIKAEVMDELAIEAGIGEQVAAVTSSAMRGEIDFVESFEQRLALLNGLSSDVMEGVYQRIQPMEGIATLMSVLHHYGWHTAILSGGFTYFADKVQAEYGMTEVHANVLEIKNNALTGKHLGDIVDGERKKWLLTRIVEQQHVAWSQTIACGDGANDLLMLNHAALGVALHAKPLVRERAPCPMNNLGLEGILYLLGMTSTEIAAF